MARWGNALGGWKRQPRNRKGQFGRGNGKATPVKKKASSSRRAISAVARKSQSPAAKRKAAIAKDRAKQGQRNRQINAAFAGLSGPPRTGHIGGGVVAVAPQRQPAQPVKKKMSGRKKAAIGAGVVLGTAAAGAVVYNMEHRNIKAEFARQGGAYATMDMGGGVSVASVSKLKKMSVNLDMGSIDKAMNGRNGFVKAYGAATTIRPSFRPQIVTTHHLHKDGVALGYVQDVTVGKKLKAETMYLRQESRGDRRTVSAMSKAIKLRQAQQVAAGRKIVISKYRSEDSERIVRNQARQLGEANVKVKKRYKTKSNMVDEIAKSMDDTFKAGGQKNFDNVRAKARKAGIII